MTSLVVRFDCKDAEAKASEFQHHLVGEKLRVQPEVRGTEIWLSYPDMQDDVLNKIVQEAHPWCLDRGLTMMQGSEQGPSHATTLLIADLARAVG